METETNKSYSELVIAGKRLIEKIGELKELEKAYQAKIAKYALTACDIRHGGYSKGLYTLKDYALAIGLNPKSVQNWTAIYRDILLKIGLDDPTIEEWRNACKVSCIINTEKTIDNEKNGTVKGKGEYKKRMPKEKVRGLFDAIQDKPFVNECESLTKSAKNTKHTLLQNADNLNAINEFSMTRMEKASDYAKALLEKRDMDIVTDDRLLHLMETLDEASEIINEYLTSKIKKRA